MRVIPREDAIETIEKVLLFMETMRLSRILDQFTFHIIMLQPAIQLLALVQRVGGISFP